MEREDHLDLSRVEWSHVLPRLGIDEHLISNAKRRGPCPICGGTSRFRFTNKDGRGAWVCNCGAGDGVRLIAMTNGITDAAAILELRRLIYGVEGQEAKFTRTTPPPPPPTKSPEEIQKARVALRKAWEKGGSIEGSLAWLYLLGRVSGLEFQWLNHSAFRYRDDLYHLDEGQGMTSKRPALLSLVSDAASPGEAITLHRTYLDPRGGKAKVSAGQEKKLMTAVVEKIQGHSVKLNTACGPVVIVTEGIENGLSWVAAHQNKVPVFAGLNCYNLAQFTWPKGTKVLIIAGDHDAVNTATGLRPGFHNAMRLKERAIKAGVVATVRLPQVQGIDWDDLWNAGEIDQFRLMNARAPVKSAA